MASTTWTSEAGIDHAADAPIVAPMRWLLASLAGGAAIIHLAMVPSHMDEWAVEGVGFAVAGLLQMTLAALFLARPSRALLLPAAALSAALIAIWAVSRTAGLPAGPHSGHAESASFIDVTCVALEAALIAVAAVALARPSFLRGQDSDARYLTVVGSLAVLVIATAAVASPSARDHAAGSHGEHGHAMDDAGFSLLSNGHAHAEYGLAELDATTQAQLDWQLAITRNVAQLYPTVAAAEAAGYFRAGPYSPGLGAHYMKIGEKEFNPDGVISDDDAAHPFSIIYEGTDPDSRVAGFMYYSTSPTTPDGFAGPNDVWHYHERICVKIAEDVVEVPFGPDNASTQEQCASVGGQIIERSAWMVHVWSVPGYDDIPGGTFTEHNPDLRCPDGTYYQLPVEEWAAHPLSTCLSAA